MPHIDFDEMVRFIYSEKIDGEYIRLAARINSHIFECPDCRKAHRAICDFKESVDNIAFEKSSYENIRVRVLKYIYNTSNAHVMPLEKMLEDFQAKLRRKSADCILKIKSLSEISAAGLMGGAGFYHPQYSGVLKSSGSYARTETKDVLVDENYNRISIAQDGTLILRLQRNICAPDSIVYLVPAEPSSDIQSSIAKEDSDGMVRAVYDDVCPGDYTIFL